MALKLSNQIEDILPYLHEVGAPILKQGIRIRQLQSQIQNLEQELKVLREVTLQEVKQDWVDSEIEAADVMANRNKV